MKKIYFSLASFLFLISFIPCSYAKDNNVKVYMFTKNGCSACEKTFSYFEEKLKATPDAFELINIEVWCGTDYTDPNNPSWILSSKDALSLMQNILKNHNKDPENLATPTIVVGDYLTIGVSDIDALYEKIVKYQTSKDYQDEVASIAKKQGYDISKMVKEHGTKSCDVIPGKSKTEESSSKGKYDAIIIISVFVILIGGFIGLIFISKKS